MPQPNLRLVSIRGILPRAYENRQNTQFLHHRAHRPRQIDAGRPPAAADRHHLRPGYDRAGAGQHGSGAREGGDDQGLGGAHELQRQGRADLRIEPDRHARARRLRLRGQPGAERLRRGAAGGGRLAGHRSPDHRQPVPGPGSRLRNHPDYQQDRPAVGAPRPGGGRDQQPDRHTRRPDPAHLGQSRTERGKRAGENRGAGAAAERG